MESKTIISLLCTWCPCERLLHQDNARMSEYFLPTTIRSINATGSYSSENIGINSNGKHLGESELSITVDADGVFSGERSWSSDRHSGHSKDGTITKGDKE